MFRLWSASALMVLCASAVPSSVKAGAITDYNLVVGGNLNSNSNVGGLSFVAGSLIGNMSSDYGTRLPKGSAAAGVDSLTVAGNVNVPGGNFNVNAGNVRVGGVVQNGNFNWNDKNHLTYDPSLGTAATAVMSEIRAASAYYAGLASNSVAVSPTTQPSNIVFEATPGPDGLAAVFNVDASVFSNPLAQQIVLKAGAGVLPGTSFIVNVTGKVVDFTQGNFGGLFTDEARRPNVLWNFQEATSIALGREWHGTILAPNANLTNQNQIQGSVFVGGDFTQRGAVLPPTYQGMSPVPTPEPSIAALLALPGVAGAFGVWRRKARRRVAG